MKLTIQRAGKQVAQMVVERSGYIAFVRVEKSHQGQGLATVLLNRAKAKFGQLYGFAEPDADGGLSCDQIATWLKRHGFKPARMSLEPGARKKHVLLWEQS